MPITPDNLTTVLNVQTMIGLPDQTENALISLIIPEVSAAIAERLGRPALLLTNAAQPLTRFYSGKGDNWLVLQDRPVYTPILAGNTIANSAVVTNLSSTAFLFVNQPVTGATLPVAPAGIANVSILSIDSSSQVTLTQPAAASGTAVPLFFGLNVWEDDTGYWGSPSNSFGVQSQLTWGSDYAIKADEPDGSSRIGLLQRLQNVWNTQFVRPGDMLSQLNATGLGNIQVQSMAGWATVPPDLELATIRLIAKVRNSRTYGVPLQSESFENYSYNLAQMRSVINFGIIDDPIIARYANAGLGDSLM